MHEDKNAAKAGITRRRFLREAGLLLGGATVGSLPLLSACNSGVLQTGTSSATNGTAAGKVTITQTASPVTVTVAPGSSRHTVLNPCGFPPPLTQVAMAPRPASLSGKPVYLVDVTFDNGDLFLDQMKDWFTQNMPQVTPIRRTKKGSYSTDDPALWKEIQAAGGVMVMAIGH